MSDLWRFSPLDSCFFREAKPFNAGEGGYLDSVFPPPVQTLIGAFRTAVGETMGVDWKQYAIANQPEVQKVIGTKDCIAPLSFGGPLILKDENRLYTAPFHLLTRLKDGKREWARLVPGDATACDMGKMNLPKTDRRFDGGKTPEGVWLDGENLKKILDGDVPASAYVDSELFAGEARAGIARNNAKRTVDDGLLYFTRHLRLQPGVSFGLSVDGLAENAVPRISRLGGEGRMAELTRVTAGDTKRVLDAPTPRGDEKGLILTLLTSGDFGGEASPDFSEFGLELFSACIGKPIREGGWDYARRAPKPLVPLVPAGSSYFVEAAGGLSEKITELHGSKIGNRTDYGYGEIAVGLWS